MKILSTAKRMLRGEVSTRAAALEATRRIRQLSTQRRERASLAQLDHQPARLRAEFARIRAADLLAHFHSRLKPKFFPGFADLKNTVSIQQQAYPKETARLVQQAERIAKDHCWPLLGFGEKCFGEDEIDWNRDPLSGFHWPLDFHADLSLHRGDGSDARVLWELNRHSHFITLGRAYAITNDAKFSAAFFDQLSSWRRQNPVARGANWTCAMEVALRAMNLLAAFALFLRAPQMDAVTLKELLNIFNQHGAHIQRNLEFSNIATSNHYLADITGLLWLGLMLPELESANEWRDFGLRELLAEMDKQTLADGADYEASTGYHRLKVELYLYSFVLCHLNGIEIEERYWTRLRAMIAYMAAYLRPDGRAPLIGDSDSGQVMPLVRRTADDHSSVLALGATIFQEPRFELPTPAIPEELLWILGGDGIRDYKSLPDGSMPASQGFPNAGIYILRDDDLYLLFNASDSGVNGRGSHGHNDALSVEVSAGGVPFILDPGTYLYTADLNERHLFRSTAYHSTVQIDRAEQNTIDQQVPFIIGNEAQPKVIDWRTDSDTDVVVAEHYGYQRLAQPITHRRAVRFDKKNRFWLIEDELSGSGSHEADFRFHFAPRIESKLRPDGIVELWDKMSGARLLIIPKGLDSDAVFENSFSSRDYGAKEPSVSVCWMVRAELPLTTTFLLVPVQADEDENLRLELLKAASDSIGNPQSAIENH